MLSTKFKLLLAGFFIQASVFSVNQLNKVDDLFKTGKYAKVFKKANQLKSESAYHRKAKTYFYMGFSLLKLSNEKAKKLGVSNRERSIVNYVLKGVKYQKSESEMNTFNNLFPDFINVAKSRMVEVNRLKREREIKEIVELLAVNFNDTIPQYWKVFPIKDKVEAETVKEVEVEVPAGPNSRQDSILNWAKTYIGTPYLYAGESRRGIDCSGFTSTILNHFGAELPHSCKMQSKLGKQTKEYKVGDLAFFGYKKDGKYYPSHVAIVVSNYPEPLRVIHATTSLGVRIDDVSKSTYWQPKLLYTREVM